MRNGCYTSREKTPIAASYSSLPISTGNYKENTPSRNEWTPPLSFFNITRISKWAKYPTLTDVANQNTNQRFTKHNTGEGACVTFFWNMHDSYFYPSDNRKVTNTPKAIVERYCPRGENPDSKVDSYIADVCSFLTKTTGKNITQNTILAFNSMTMKSLARIMSMIESGKSVQRYVDTAWNTFYTQIYPNIKKK